MAIKTEVSLFGANAAEKINQYGKSSKILHTSCLLKGPKQTAQTQIRLLLMRGSDQGLTCLLF